MENKPFTAIIGCGNVGTQAAVYAAAASYPLMLFDVVEGLAQGRELDLAQAARPAGFDADIRAVESLEDTLDADIFIITAGKARKPGMSREDLARENANIIRGIAQVLKKAKDDAVFILVTNPLDAMVTLFVNETGRSRNQVLGMGGILDSARMAYFLSTETDVPARDIEAWVLGAHSDSMVPCFSLTRIDGKPAVELLSSEQMERVAERTKKGGAEIVGFLKTGSAFIAPGASVFRLLSAVVNDEGALLPVSVVARGEYGLEGAAIGLPCVIGREGIREVRELELADSELGQLRLSFEEVKQVEI